MARTKASVGAKVSSHKSSKARCSTAAPSAAPGTSGIARSSGAGNPVCPRETPKWQRPITNFFIQNEERDRDDKQRAAGSSKSKRNIIESSDEENSPKKAKETTPMEIEKSPKTPERNEKFPKTPELNEKSPETPELNETIELEELNGESCHKLQEYYPKTDKGKGVGKKSKNLNNNCSAEESRNSKREREDGVEEGNSSKKIKV